MEIGLSFVVGDEEEEYTEKRSESVGQGRQEFVLCSLRSRSESMSICW